MTKSKKEKLVRKQEVPFDEYVEKYFWLVIPIVTLLYFWLSYVSIGFYQDVEIAQFLNAVKFKVVAFSILGNNPMPGWKIFLILSAMIDYKAVLIFNSLIASFTVFFTFRLIKEYKVNLAYYGAMLLALQPLFINFFLRAYSERFTAFIGVNIL